MFTIHNAKSYKFQFAVLFKTTQLGNNYHCHCEGRQARGNLLVECRISKMFKVWHAIDRYFYFHCYYFARQYREIATSGRCPSSQ